MSSRDRFRLLDLGSRAAVAALALLLAPLAQAQYKVIGADGKVTYTDREPTAAEGRVTSLGARASAPAAEPELPLELRQVNSRYPVTLYTITGACEPCVSGRLLLRQRGIPFNERQIVTAEDSEALERLSGGRDAPTLTIGTQTLRGLAGDVWHSYLDAAGYPKESRLPTSYQYRPAEPIVARRDLAPARPALPSDAPPPASPTRPVAPPASGIRF